MDNRQDIFDSVAAQIEPFNKKDIALTEATTFAGDLEWDSLTVMDFVAAIEDEFDIIITMNMQAEIRSEEHTSELQTLMRISYAVFCLKKKNNKRHEHNKRVTLTIQTTI